MSYKITDEQVDRLREFALGKIHERGTEILGMDILDLLNALSEARERDDLTSRMFLGLVHDSSFDYQGAKTFRDTCRSTCDQVEKLVAELSEARQERDYWKNTLIDAAVVNWVLTDDNQNNPRELIDAITEFNMKIALDPAVSKPAHDLVQRAEKAESALQCTKDDLLFAQATLNAISASLDRAERDKKWKRCIEMIREYVGSDLAGAESV